MLTTPLLRLVKNRQAVAVASKRSVHIERRLAELGYVLPQVAEPKGNYRTAVRTGNYIFTGAFAAIHHRSADCMVVCVVLTCVCSR